MPLGAHVQLDTPFLTDDTRRGAGPPSVITHSWERPDAVRRVATAPVSSGERLEMKETDLPSGSQRGDPGDQLSSTRTIGVPVPLVFAIQTCGIRRFAARSTRETTYTTWEPSGDTRGSLANSKLK
jgi:hypothetical protein